MTQRRVTWKSEYEVGVVAIDEQHKRLFAMLDKLTQPDQDIKHTEMILALGSYINKHFAYEECLPTIRIAG